MTAAIEDLKARIAKEAPLLKSCDPRNYLREERDAELFAKELRSFVPPDAFDAHVHWYDLRHLVPPGVTLPEEAFGGNSMVGFDLYKKHTERWMGDRAIIDGLAFPFPFPPMDIHAANDSLFDDLDRPVASKCRGLMMLKPGMDPDEVEKYVAKRGVRGFKVYHLFAKRPDTMNCDQSEFLPEWAWEIADKHGFWITMHMVLDRALADPRNQRYIREHCLRYPNVKYVLAHNARGFNANHTVDGVRAIRGLDNVYFDSSAACEPASFEAIIREFGTTRLMYGSDYPISEMRGRPVSVGDGFYWMYDHNVKWDGWKLGQHQNVGNESLLAFKHACTALNLTDSDVERMFCITARELLGIRPAPSGDKAQAMYREAKSLIPGGTQLLSKRPEMFAPDQWPSYYEQSIGCEVVDVAGRRYTDMSFNSVGACLLGYADPDVNGAVMRRVTLGQVSVLNPAEEVELARLLMKIHPWAQHARFARSGGEAVAVAVRIARAATGRDVVAFCGYHGWGDWYLAANLGANNKLNGHLLPGLSPTGVPSQLAGTAHPFTYNKLDELAAIIREHGKNLAAVVMEPTRSVDPDPGFLEGVRELCDKSGARLVFDEVSIGWRLCLGGAHLKYGVTPDMAVYAKAIGNGFPISAIVGKANTMAAAQDSFISSSFWTEGVGVAAAVATVKKLMRIDVPAHVKRIGEKHRAGLHTLAKAHGLPVKTSGHPCFGVFSFDVPGQDAAALMTLYTVTMLTHGYLAGAGFYPMLSHEDRHVDACIAAADKVFAEIADAVKKNNVKGRIGGPVKHTGFARLA